MRFAPENIRPFLVLFQGRAGSTYLIESLRSHPKIYVEEEKLVIFRRDRRPDLQLQWTAEYLTPPPLGRYAAIGFKTKLTDILDWQGFAFVLRQLGTHIIYLERRNCIKQVVSFFTGKRLYQRTRNWALYKDDDRVSAIKIEVADFAGRLKHVEEQNQEVAQYVENLKLPTLHIFYEDLLINKTVTIKRVLGFLGLDCEPLVADSNKHTSDNLRHVLSNFEELRGFYTGTKYEQMFEEILLPNNPYAL